MLKSVHYSLFLLVCIISLIGIDVYNNFVDVDPILESSMQLQIELCGPESMPVFSPPIQKATFIPNP